MCTLLPACWGCSDAACRLNSVLVVDVAAVFVSVYSYEMLWYVFNFLLKRSEFTCALLNVILLQHTLIHKTTYILFVTE